MLYDFLTAFLKNALKLKIQPISVLFLNMAVPLENDRRLYIQFFFVRCNRTINVRM